MRYWAVRYLLSTLTAVVVFATPAHAQSTSAGPYVFGGWSLQVREGTALNGVTFGGGVPLTATVSAEGSVGWYSNKSADATFNSPLGFIDMHSRDRDVPLVGAIRWSPRCDRRICPELVGGAGVNYHVVSTRIVITCPPPGMVVRCVESDRADEGSHAEWLIAVGMDMKVRVNGQFAVVPGFRLSLPARIAVPAIFPGNGVAEQVPYYLLNVTAFYRFGS